MKDLILKANDSFSLFEKGDTITVALSGGADSVAMLHALIGLRDKFSLTVNAAHLNHSIRGDEADRDESFVKELCKNLDIELFCEKLDVPKYANENHLSLELAARELRYDFLNRVATGKIATAHTASDNLETLLFNLSRGTALKGLCGIPPKRDNIIRPVIFCTRQNIEEYCIQNNLFFVTDSTNLSDDYSRNKIRHNIVPVIKDINNNAEVLAVKTAIALSEDNDYLDATAKEVLFKHCDDDTLLIDELNKLHSAIAKRVIKEYFNILYPDVLLENRHINGIYNICILKQGKVNLPCCIYAEVNDSRLSFYSNEIENIDFSVKIEETENVNNLFSNNLLDYDKIIGKLIVRTRNEGDSIRLQNRGCTKTLKKLYCEYKIPLNIRDNLPVIADDKGVVWIHTIGVCGRCAVTANTIKAYKIEVEKL